MTPKQALFVAEYLKDLNGTQAAIRAGYSAKTAGTQAEQLLRKLEIAEAVKAGQSEQLAAAGVTAQKVKDRLALLAFQDIRQLFDEHGNLRPLHQLSAEAAAMVGGFEVIKKNAQAGDGVVDTVHKVKVVDPVKSLEMLAKHFGLLVERLDVQGDLTIKWQD